MSQQQKIKDIIGKFGKGGGSPGLGLGVKLLIGAGGLAWAAANSVYTGELLTKCLYEMIPLVTPLHITVEGGHRSIIFSRIGGVQPDVYSEGLHFKVPWFQWPIIYDIRSKPKKISSPTGSKDLQMVNITLRVLQVIFSSIELF